MHNLQPGDLALTLMDLGDVGQGSVVEVVDRIEAGDFISVEGRMYMSTESGWSCVQPSSADRFAYPDRALMPLRGDFKPEEDDLAEYADTSFYDLRTGRQRLVGGRV